MRIPGALWGRSSGKPRIIPIIRIENRLGTPTFGIESETGSNRRLIGFHAALQAAGPGIHLCVRGERTLPKLSCAGQVMLTMMKVALKAIKHWGRGWVR